MRTAECAADEGARRTEIVALNMHSITGKKAFAERTACCWTFAFTIQNRSQPESVLHLGSLLQPDNEYLTVKLHTDGSFKYAFISSEPPGVLIRTFLANNQTGNCSLTAGNFHQTAVNLCIRVSSFSLTWRVIPIRQQLILIIQSVS